MAQPNSLPNVINPLGTDPHFPPSMVPSAASAAPKSLPPPKAVAFTSEHIRLPDALGRNPAFERIAQLIAHKNAHGPLTIAVLGDQGAGKTHALRQIVDIARQLSRLAEKTETGPFTPRLSIVQMDVCELASGPESALATRLNLRLSADYPALTTLVGETVTTAQADPQSLARQSAAALESVRQSLIEAQRALDVAQSRRARLNETLIYETSGSQFDSWARAHRGRIETALRAFGFDSADSLADYRGLVHTLSESGGLGGQIFASLRALWAYRGQTKRLLWATGLYILARFFGYLGADPSWLAPIAQLGELAQPIAQWIRGHLWLFQDARFVAMLAMWACLASLFWRAWRFGQPLWRGVRLLDEDVERRRGELDREIAHHAQRVDALARESDTLAARLADQERRAGGKAAAASVAPLFAAPQSGSSALARAYFIALNKAMSAANVQSAQAAPTRILVVVDGLENLPPQRSIEILSHLASAIALPAFALLVAFNPERLEKIEDGADAALRVFQTFWVAPAQTDQDWRAFIKQLDSAPAIQQQAPILDNRSELDAPLTDGEHRMLSQMAALAGPAPRNVARLVNAYRLARFDALGDKAALAFMLALRIGGTPSERASVAQALNDKPEAVFRLSAEASPRLRTGARAAEAFMAEVCVTAPPSSIGAVSSEPLPLTQGAMRRADYISRRWTYTKGDNDGALAMA